MEPERKKTKSTKEAIQFERKTTIPPTHSLYDKNFVVVVA